MAKPYKIKERFRKAGFSDSYLDDVQEVLGPGYPKGMTIGKALIVAVREKRIDRFRPPIFSLNHDRGEFIGFCSALSVPFTPGDKPKMHLDTVVSLLENGYDLSPHVKPVNVPSELLEGEDFMHKRLPAVRVYLLK